MTNAATLHQEQVDYWNGVGGQHWVAQQLATDLMMANVRDVMLASTALGRGAHVLDIGCGCGDTTAALADVVGPGGKVVGLDVSAPMLKVAETRLKGRPNVSFLCADAATATLPPVDLLVSRFGVMFFGNPDAAFANMRKSLKPGGRLVFICWRKFDENPWMQIPLFAAYEHVPKLPKLGPEDPGPFSFANTERVTRILTTAGFGTPRFTPRDVVLDISGGDGLEGAVYQTTHIGATSRALDGQPDAARDAAVESIRKALTPFATPTGVLLKGSIWVVEADNA